MRLLTRNKWCTTRNQAAPTGSQEFLESVSRNISHSALPDPPIVQDLSCRELSTLTKILVHRPGKVLSNIINKKQNYFSRPKCKRLCDILIFQIFFLEIS